MITAAQGTVFALTFAASAGAPGAETAALLGRALSRGLRATLPLAAGIVVGKLLMLTAAVAGLAAAVAVLGPAFVALQIAGAVYLAHLAWKRWRRAGQALDTGAGGSARVAPEIGLGLVLTLSNPIAIAFYLALLPGVVDLERLGAVSFAVLAGLLVAVMAVVVLVYGLSAEAARSLLSSDASAVWVDRAVSVVFAAAAVWLVLRGTGI